MTDPTDSTSRSVTLSGNGSLSVGGNSLISRGLQDLAELAATPSSMPSVQTDDIHEAARNGDNASVRQILKNDPAKIEAKDRNGRTPLHLATAEGHGATAELLLSRGAEIEARDNDGWSALHWAALLGQPDTAELLLSRGAKVNAYSRGFRPVASHDAHDDDGCTPLHWAALLSRRKTANVLLSHGAEVDARDKHGKTPRDYWEESRQHSLTPTERLRKKMDKLPPHKQADVLGRAIETLRQKTQNGTAKNDEGD